MYLSGVNNIPDDSESGSSKREKQNAEPQLDNNPSIVVVS